MSSWPNNRHDQAYAEHRRRPSDTEGLQIVPQGEDTLPEPVARSQGFLTSAPSYRASVVSENPSGLPPSYEDVVNPIQEPNPINEKATQCPRASTGPIPPHDLHQSEKYDAVFTPVSRTFLSSSESGADAHRNHPAYINPDPVPSTSVNQPGISEKINGGLDILVDAISRYFEAQMKIHAERPRKALYFDRRKAVKVQRAIAKFQRQMEKGKDLDKVERKMGWRAEKMNLWTQMLVEKANYLHGPSTYTHPASHVGVGTGGCGGGFGLASRGCGGMGYGRRYAAGYGCGRS